MPSNDTRQPCHLTWPSAYRPVTEDRGQQVQASMHRGQTLRRNRALLAQMLANLKRTQLHTSRGTRVQLELKPVLQALKRIIADDGHGIPATAPNCVLSRLVRLYNCRTIIGNNLSGWTWWLQRPACQARG